MSKSALNLLIVVLCLVWGFNFVVMKSANGVFMPITFAAYRFLVGAAVLFGVVMFKRIPLPAPSQLKWYVLCGILQTTYFNLAIQVSLNYVSAGLVSVLTYSMPLFLNLMVHFAIVEERLTARRFAGIIVGMLGLFLAMNVTTIDGSIWALVLALSSAVAWAISNLIIKTKLSGCDKFQFTAWQMLIGAVLLAIFGIGFEGLQAQWSLQAVGYVLFSGIIASAFAFVLWTYILSKIQAGKAAIYLLMVPVVGIVSSYLFLGETLAPISLVGVALVLSGIGIVNWNN